MGALGPGRPSRATGASAALGRARPPPRARRPVPPPSSRSTWRVGGSGFLQGGALAVLVAALLLLAGLALPGAAAQAAQGRAKQLPKCATVTETGSCRVRRVGSPHSFMPCVASLCDVDLHTLGDNWSDRFPGPHTRNMQAPLFVLKNPTVTVQQDGEEAVEVSPKRIAKQWAATVENYGQFWTRGVNLDLSKWDTVCTRCETNSHADQFHRATLREETYKKSKKTGTEKLRCKLDGLDAELVDDLVRLPGPVPCTLEFRTPCDDDELD